MRPGCGRSPRRAGRCVWGERTQRGARGVLARGAPARGTSRPTSASVRIRAAIAAALGKGWNTWVDVVGACPPGPGAGRRCPSGRCTPPPVPPTRADPGGCPGYAAASRCRAPASWSARPASAATVKNGTPVAAIAARCSAHHCDRCDRVRSRTAPVGSYSSMRRSKWSRSPPVRAGPKAFSARWARPSVRGSRNCRASTSSATGDPRNAGAHPTTARMRPASSGRSASSARVSGPPFE